MAVVLVIDENIEKANELSELLVILGHEVYAVCESHTAIDFINRKFPAFDAIFVSFAMSDIPGSSVAAFAKEGNRSIKVVMLTFSNLTKEQMGGVVDDVICRGEVLDPRTVVMTLNTIGI